jgi:hypothetical protein
VLASPRCLVGSIEQIIEDIQLRRERYGISYITVLEFPGMPSRGTATLTRSMGTPLATCCYRASTWPRAALFRQLVLWQASTAALRIYPGALDRRNARISFRDCSTPTQHLTGILLGRVRGWTTISSNQPVLPRFMQFLVAGSTCQHPTQQSCRWSDSSLVRWRLSWMHRTCPPCTT